MEAYLLHDANAGSNLKLMIMIQEEGMKGYGIYWTGRKAITKTVTIIFS